MTSLTALRKRIDRLASSEKQHMALYPDNSFIALIDQGRELKKSLTDPDLIVKSLSIKIDRIARLARRNQNPVIRITTYWGHEQYTPAPGARVIKTHWGSGALTDENTEREFND